MDIVKRIERIKKKWLDECEHDRLAMWINAPTIIAAERILKMAKKLTLSEYSANELIALANELEKGAAAEIFATCDPDGRGGGASELSFDLSNAAIEIWLHALKRPVRITKPIIIPLIIGHYQEKLKGEFEKVRDVAKKRNLKVQYEEDKKTNS
jgi:hypothetical protein